MKKLLLFAGLAWASVTAIAAEPLQLIVMDPLSKDLACACVKGYAQRNYKVLAAHLQVRTGLDVQVAHGETLADALKNSGGAAHVLVGKYSVLLSEAKKNGRTLRPVASLTGKDGSTFQKGFLVVRKDSAAHQLADLQGFRMFFGPSDCDEKSVAVQALLTSAGIQTVPEVSASCSTAAEALMKLAPSERAAAVISSYAEPLLSGCGTIKPGDLRIVAKTAEVPFITAFLDSALPAETAKQIEDALLSSESDPKLLEALESLLGFIEPELPPAPSVAPPAAILEKPATPGTPQAWNQFRGPARDGTADWLPETLPAAARFAWTVPLPSDGVGGIAATPDAVLVSCRNQRDSADVFFCSMRGQARNAGGLSILPLPSPSWITAIRRGQLL